MLILFVYPVNKYASVRMVFALLILMLQCNELFTMMDENLPDELVSFDDDLELQKVKTKVSQLPKYGKDFEVWIHIRQAYDKNYENSNGEEYQKLRKNLQKALLGIYVDDQTYIDTLLIGFGNRSNDLVAKLLMRFSKNSSDHLELLSQHLQTETLGDLDVFPFVAYADVADHDELQKIFCSDRCSPTVCDAGCQSHCCTSVLVPAIIQPIGVIPSVLPRPMYMKDTIKEMNIMSHPFQPNLESMWEISNRNMLNNMIIQIPSPQYMPTAADSAIQDPLWNHFSPIQSQLCDARCKAFCSPDCNPSCCSPFYKIRKRSKIERRDYRRRF